VLAKDPADLTQLQPPELSRPTHLCGPGRTRTALVPLPPILILHLQGQTGDRMPGWIPTRYPRSSAWFGSSGRNGRALHVDAVQILRPPPHHGVASAGDGEGHSWGFASESGQTQRGPWSFPVFHSSFLSGSDWKEPCRWTHVTRGLFRKCWMTGWLIVVPPAAADAARSPKLLLRALSKW